MILLNCNDIFDTRVSIQYYNISTEWASKTYCFMENVRRRPPEYNANFDSSNVPQVDITDERLKYI